MLLNVVSLFKNQQEVEDLLGERVNTLNSLCVNLGQSVDIDIFMYTLTLDEYFEWLDVDRVADAILCRGYHIYYQLSDNIGVVNICMVKDGLNVVPQGYTRYLTDETCTNKVCITTEYKYTYYDELAYRLRIS